MYETLETSPKRAHVLVLSAFLTHALSGVLSQQVQQALVLVSTRLKAATEWRARCRDVLANTPIHRVTLSELDILISEAYSLQARAYVFREA